MSRVLLNNLPGLFFVFSHKDDHFEFGVDSTPKSGICPVNLIAPSLQRYTQFKFIEIYKNW